MQIGSKKIGSGQPAFVIAEVSANHRGDINVAKHAIESASRAGADAVKFQHLRGEKIAADIHIDALWNDKPVGTLSEFYKHSELPYEWTPELAAHAKKHNIIFLSTPFDTEAVDVLEPFVPAYKVASYEMTDDILLRYIAGKGKPVILSTGMAYNEEVRHALDVLAQEGLTDVVVLHCVSMYPPEPQDFNLKAIETMRRELGAPIGFSDHSEPSSNIASLGAVALGACVIERHITDSQEGGSHDDKNSMTIQQFEHMIREIRILEQMMGDGIKKPIARPEAPMDEVRERGTRRSLYAARDIAQGEILSEDMLITLRPVCGVEPKDTPLLLGKKFVRPLKARDPIRLEDVE